MSQPKLIYSGRNREKRAKQFKWKTYRPHFLDIIAAHCTKDIEEAKKRVELTDKGYKYTPSKEYVRFLIKHSKKSHHDFKTQKKAH